MEKTKKNVLIMGAAGRDFHNFNMMYRENPNVNVVAFTATQIPDIDGRAYPLEIAGPQYSAPIPIYSEDKLSELIEQYDVSEVLFSYSDVPHEYVMHKAAEVNAAGARFVMASAKETMIKSNKPVIAVCAVRTGCGKSQTTRYIANLLKESGKKIAVIRHPMPYGDLVAQKVQRFTKYQDFLDQKCTIEEIEEYEHHVNEGSVVFAGVDYGLILKEAEKEADVILWDGGNNDMSFYNPDLLITLVDPLRPGHETRYYPGETNLRMADVIIINKCHELDLDKIMLFEESIRQVNPNAEMLFTLSPVTVENEKLIAGKKVLVIEDGPTLTHGEMKYGAGIVAAKKLGATLVDPREYAVGSIADTFAKYPEIGTLLPAMGYGDAQMRDLEATIDATPCDAVVIATPIDLGKLIKIKKANTRVTYRLEEWVGLDLKDIVNKVLE